MTAQVIPIIERDPQTTGRRPGIAGLWCSSWLVYLLPFLSRRWPRASLAQAVVVACINVPVATGWLYLALVGAEAFGHITATKDLDFYGYCQLVAGNFHNMWSAAALVDRVAITAGGAVLLLAYFLIPFFVLLPFAARPGANKACLQHVMRTVLLGSGAVFVWGPALALPLFILNAWRPHTGSVYDLIPVLLTGFNITILWAVPVLIHAVRRDYRTTADLPAPHDPTCDECGYNIIAAEMDGRCPECGTPVADSLGPHVRLPTPWERRPNPFRLPVLLRQLRQLIRSPRRLFFSMPTLTGQRASQRWLLLSMIPVGLLAAAIVPALSFVGDVQWTWRLAVGALAMGLVWAGLALMMVGIETTGVATFSRVRGFTISLATAAKVTTYASTLMIPWVILGGLQLLAFYYAEDRGLFRHFKASLRTEQIILAVSLGLAHIGGLLWFELTVYRGIRFVQFANK